MVALPIWYFTPPDTFYQVFFGNVFVCLSVVVGIFFGESLLPIVTKLSFSETAPPFLYFYLSRIFFSIPTKQCTRTTQPTEVKVVQHYFAESHSLTGTR